MGALIMKREAGKYTIKVNSSKDAQKIIRKLIIIYLKILILHASVYTDINNLNETFPSGLTMLSPCHGLSNKPQYQA